MPVISKYQLGVILAELYQKKMMSDDPRVEIQKYFPERTDLNKCLRRLLENGVLFERKDLSGIFTMLGKSDTESELIACHVDPFCYISHLSAMSYHGITDRLPVTLTLSTPPPKLWHEFSLEKMKKDLGKCFDQYCKNKLPKLARINLQKINKTHIHRVHSKHLGAYKNVRDRPIRVSTIGRTFLDMLRNPDLCGGINHVLNVYKENGAAYLKLIIDEVDRNGSPIEKVRAGYIFDECLAIDNDVINNWVKFAQRGGSRKLDPGAEYFPKWSDKWKISLNN